MKYVRHFLAIVFTFVGSYVSAWIGLTVLMLVVTLMDMFEMAAPVLYWIFILLFGALALGFMLLPFTFIMPRFVALSEKIYPSPKGLRYIVTSVLWIIAMLMALYQGFTFSRVYCIVYYLYLIWKVKTLFR